MRLGETDFLKDQQPENLGGGRRHRSTRSGTGKS
jgi:hypothetical protein